MMIRTDQLLCVTKATWSKIYTRDSEAKTHGRKKTLVLSLKQYHAYYYWFYEKGMTRAMVGPQGLHLSDAFWWSNVSASVGLKLYCPQCFKLGDNTKTIATHLREVHYQLANTCDLCKSFAYMSAQVIMEHCSGCKVKHEIECTEQEGHEAKSCTRRIPRQENRINLPKVSLSSTDDSCRAKDSQHLLSNSADEHWLI